MASKPNRLLKVVLILTAIPMILVWLPLIRGLMDGTTYQWGHSFLGFQYNGQGIYGFYWLLILQAVFCVALVNSGWRGARQPFHWLLLIWNIAYAVDAVYNSLKFPENYRFHGDTLGVDVSLAWAGPLYFGGLALLSLVWVARDFAQKQSPEVIAWNRRNSALLIVAVALLPAQFFLLKFGEPHGTTDQLGVILTMLQWVIINMSFVGWQSEKLLSREAHA